MLSSSARRIAQHAIKAMQNSSPLIEASSASPTDVVLSSISSKMALLNLSSLSPYINSSPMISLRSFTTSTVHQSSSTNDDTNNSIKSSPRKPTIVPQTPKEIDQVLEDWGAAMDRGDWDHAWDIFENSFPVDEPHFPSLEDILAWNPDEEERAERRVREHQLQEEIAKSRIRKVDPNTGMAHGVGKRKTSVARVWLRQGNGHFMINKRPYDDYFPSILRRNDLIAPFLVTNTLGKFDVMAAVHGGGMTGQAQAMRHGIARALQNWEPEMRGDLKAAGLLTRDARIVERKKPGRKKARKAFQWVKR